MIVSDLIFESFLDMGAVAPGENLTTAESADGLLRLNQLIASWSIEQLTVPNMLHTQFTLTAGTSVYTLGTGGTLVTAARAIRVTGAASISGTFRQPVEVMSHDKFAATVQDPLATTSVLALKLAADGSFPSLNLRVFPVPATSPGFLLLDYWSALTAFAALSDTVSLPEGFEDALHFALAVRLYPQYARAGGMPPELLGNATMTKNAIQKRNMDILGMAPPQQEAA